MHGTPASDLVYLLETVTPDGPQGLRAATADEIAQRLSGVQAELLPCGHSHLPRDVLAGAVRAVAYDWHAAATQGEAAVRGDWAEALRTGRVGRTESA